MAVDREKLLHLLEGARTFGRSLSGRYCVLDTNIVLDLLLFKDSKVQPLLDAIATDNILPIGHLDTFFEFADVVTRPMFQLSDSQIDQLLHEWVKLHAVFREPLSTVFFCRDKDDNKFFNLSRATGAEYLISKDKKVLKARGKAKRFGCQVVKPEQFKL